MNSMSLADLVDENKVGRRKAKKNLHLLGRGMHNEPPRDMLLSAEDVEAGWRLFFRNGEWIKITAEQARVITRGLVDCEINEEEEEL